MKCHIVNCSDIYYLLSILGTTSKLSGHYVADSIGSTLVHPIRQYRYVATFSSYDIIPCNRERKVRDWVTGHYVATTERRYKQSSTS